MQWAHQFGCRGRRRPRMHPAQPAACSPGRRRPAFGGLRLLLGGPTAEVGELRLEAREGVEVLGTLPAGRPGASASVLGVVPFAAASPSSRRSVPRRSPALPARIPPSRGIERGLLVQPRPQSARRQPSRVLLVEDLGVDDVIVAAAVRRVGAGSGRRPRRWVRWSASPGRTCPTRRSSTALLQTRCRRGFHRRRVVALQRTAGCVHLGPQVRGALGVTLGGLLVQELLGAVDQRIGAGCGSRPRPGGGDPRRHGPRRRAPSGRSRRRPARTGR